MKNNTIETIGCDLGDKRTEICRLKLDETSERRQIRTTKAALTEYFQRPRAHVVIEVGPHSRWVAELLEALGHEVTVANPRRVQLISQSDSKSDQKDADLLARLGRADRELLKPVVHRGKQAQSDLAVAKARDVLVATRTKLVNHIRSVVKSFGERLPTCSAESFRRKTRDLIPKDLSPAVDPIYAALEQIDAQIKTYDRSIDGIAKKYPEIIGISQPSGVGVLTALVFMLTLEDKARFRKSRSVGAYLGLRPKKSQSGDDDPQLRITKAGDEFVRRLLINSANHIMGPFGKESDLRRWGLRLAEHGGKNARKRAKVAVARKLSVLMHRLWVTGEEYKPVGYREAAAQTAA